MINIHCSNLGTLENLDLHDAEISIVICDYVRHHVRLPLILHSPEKKGVNASLEFESVAHINVSLTEPWGAGFYINDVTARISVELQEELFVVSVLLNSGDIIEVVAKCMVYLESE